MDERRVRVDATADAVFQAVCRLGGGHGWYASDWLWRLRGMLDRVFGGPGLRRGRRHPEQIGVGDALDFWRVIEIERPAHLLLHAEMKVPGDATLGFRIQADGDDHCRLIQTARFHPRGLSGLAYWYALRPLHGVVFRGMIQGIRRAAESRHSLSRRHSE